MGRRPRDGNVHLGAFAFSMRMRFMFEPESSTRQVHNLRSSGLKDILGRMPYGLYIIGARKSDGSFAGIIANWVTQASFLPPLISIAIEGNSEMRGHIDRAKFFSLNMLSSGSSDSVKAFLRQSVANDGRLQADSVAPTVNGTPFMTQAAASLECKVVRSIPAGDHVLFLGEIINSVSREKSDFLTLKETGLKYSR